MAVTAPWTVRAATVGTAIASAVNGSPGPPGVKTLGETRQDYLTGTAKLANEASEAIASGRSAESVAREFVPLRNALKLDVRANGPGWAAAWADTRNLLRYGDRAGPSADELYRMKGSWEAVVEDLGVTNQLVDRFAGSK